VMPKRSISAKSASAAHKATMRAQKKERAMVAQAKREAHDRKVFKKSRVIRTLTHEQAQARLTGQTTKVIITDAYPGYVSPDTPNVDIMSIAWQGGAPGLGRKR
jgi:hypothetical protein